VRSKFRPEALLGTTFAGYRVCQLIASGGIGHIYAVSSPTLPDQIALKLLRPELADKAAHMRRFEREALAASKIRHENVLEVHGGVHSEQGHFFFTTELLRGMDLADTLANQGALAPQRAARIARGAARGLAAAHAAGVVHRDVKPENLFLVHAADGREIVKLIDFGSAWLDGDKPAKLERITVQSAIVGTPEYMAPEQIELAEGHATADVYSLGVLLYEMLSGRVPFSGSWHEVLKQQLATAATPLRGVSPELARVVARLLEKKPEQRISSMVEVDAALAETPEGR
jgi:eukaryotic-like serine/threonine-protein kinase